MLRLIALWLEADVFISAQPAAGWLEQLHASLASAQLTLRDTVSSMMDDFVTDRLGQVGAAEDVYETEGTEFSSAEDFGIRPSPAGGRAARISKAALRRLLEDGLLLMLSRRAVLGRLLTPRVMGVGGAALALAALTPAALKRLRRWMAQSEGALQGAPISPLLSNVHLHPFDAGLTGRGHRLVRYCDDFVICCADETQAREALGDANRCLGERRLRCHPDKTRPVAPGEPFDFLGYHFCADGRVEPPPSVPEVVTRQVVELAERYARRSSMQAASFATASRRRARRTPTRLADKLKREGDE